MSDRKESRGPKPLGALLGDLVSSRRWGDHLAAGRLREAWEQIVGPAVAARSRPIRVVEGTLVVSAEAGAWANELTILADAIAKKADAYLGGGVVRAVKVTARGSTG